MRCLVLYFAPRILLRPSENGLTWAKLPSEEVAIQDISIVGGGPAGSLCGERLASHGFRVRIFDERLAWEKPCGGGLTHKAIEAYPFLLDSPYPKKIVRTAELISGNGYRARFEMSHPIVIYARKVLDRKS